MEDKKPTQEELEQDSFLFRAMLNLSDDAIYFKDKDGRFLAMSKWGANFSAPKTGMNSWASATMICFPRKWPTSIWPTKSG